MLVCPICFDSRKLSESELIDGANSAAQLRCGSESARGNGVQLRNAIPARQPGSGKDPARNFVTRHMTSLARVDREIASRSPGADQPAGATRLASRLTLPGLASAIGNRAMASLMRAPASGQKPVVDPRATPGHRDPLIRVPASGDPVIEQVTEGSRSISWSWEVERPGTPLTGGQPFREQVYWANFEVDAEGVMRVSARMISPTGQFRAPEWTLRNKFREALDVFRRGGVDVKAFEAEWGYMSPGEISHNLDAFFGNLKKNPGMQVEAARGTPSGKVAQENGFTEVRIVSEPGYQPSEVPGHTGISESRPVVRVRFAVQGVHDGIPVHGTAAPAPVENPPVRVAPPVSAIERPTVAPRRIPTGAKAAIGWGLQIGLFVFFWWCARERAKEQEEYLKALQANKIEPAIDDALVKQTQEGYRVHDAAPALPMYANVTIDFKSEWQESGIAGERTGEGISDANFVSLAFGYLPVQGDSEGPIERETVFMSDVAHCHQTTRVTSPILVFHPDHEEYKRHQYAAWEAWTKQHPEWAINAPQGDAGKQFQNYYWVHQRQAIQAWVQHLARKQLQDELGLSRQPTTLTGKPG